MRHFPKPLAIADRVAPRFQPMFLAIASLLFAASAFAQPALFEPAQGFYKARGTKVAATWSVDRTELPEDGVLTATLTITGATNPQEIVRPDLAKVRDDEGRLPYAERFQIEDVPGPNFVYRLRPRSANVNRLPTLDFWYDSGVKVGNPFKKTTAKGINLVVIKVVKARPPAVPLLEPDRLFELETGSLGREPFAAGWGSWLLLFAMGISIPALWYGLWRRVSPNGVRLAKLRRSRAVRRAADAIRKAKRSADPAGAIAAAVLGYLRARFALPPGADTPSEVEDALHDPAVAAFLRRCDEARFAPSSDNPLSLASDAESLIAGLEAKE